VSTTSAKGAARSCSVAKDAGRSVRKIGLACTSPLSAVSSGEAAATIVPATLAEALEKTKKNAQVGRKAACQCFKLQRGCRRFGHHPHLQADAHMKARRAPCGGS